MLNRIATAMLALAIAVPAWAGAVEDKALKDATKAFMQIKEPALRRCIVKLVQQIANND
jgi:hypothetical protein